MDGRHGFAISALTLLAIVVVDFAGVRAMGFSVRVMGIEGWAAVGILIASALYFSGVSHSYRDVHALMSPRMWASLTGIPAYVITFFVATLVMQSLAVSYRAPLVDDVLIRTDAMLGFSWPALARWYGNHPVIALMSLCTYMLWVPQVFLTCTLLTVLGHRDRMHEFLALFFLATAVSIALSVKYPAANPWIHYGFVDPRGTSPWSQFYAFRDGLRVIDISQSQGLVSLPSLHAAAAVLFAYAVRGIRFIFPASIVVNVAMTLSALYWGAHYLTDVLTGLALSVVLIGVSYAVRRLRSITPAGVYAPCVDMISPEIEES